MKFLLPSFALIATALGQGITIGAPLPGEKVVVDEDFTIQVIKNNHIMSSIEFGLAIGIVSCQEADCPPASEMGTVLYSGPFEPVLQDGISYQNFTVAVPKDRGISGPSRISVARGFLIGAGNGAVLSTDNTVNVEVSA
ncbi:hypothetical protein FQN54_002861 [Arachnomyces sp. PD_36]|nr:hypothetical protein FQN54_002861 [Arachnomyces sp. PD_36]